MKSYFLLWIRLHYLPTMKGYTSSSLQLTENQQYNNLFMKRQGYIG